MRIGTRGSTFPKPIPSTRTQGTSRSADSQKRFNRLPSQKDVHHTSYFLVFDTLLLLDNPNATVRSRTCY